MKKLIFFCCVWPMGLSIYANPSIQKMPTLVARLAKNPNSMVNFHNITHLLGNASEIDLRCYLASKWDKNVQDQIIVQRVRDVIEMQIAQRSPEEIVDFMRGWQDEAFGEIDIFGLEREIDDIIHRGSLKEVMLLLYRVKGKPTILTEEQIIELINRGTKESVILQAIVMFIARSEYWTGKRGWREHFFTVVDDIGIRNALMVNVYQVSDLDRIN